MGGIGRTGFALIAISFPVYLLWKGRLKTYLAFATSGS